MPTQAVASATTTMVEEEEIEEQMPGLQFNDPLSWRAGKPIAIGVLLRRLENLFKEIRGMEQDENERDSLTNVAKDLANPNLLAHKDKGVKAWAACCLVEILRLCAPDAPFTAQQLKDIFKTIIRGILPALSDPSNAYNNQHLHVLESLAQVKSIILLTDIPSSEELTEYLFTSFFDILAGSSKASSGELLGKNVEYNMTGILTAMVDESPTLSTEIIDVIIAQFLRTDPRALSGSSGVKSKKNGIQSDNKQSKLILRDLPPAYNMAKTICNTCPDKMGRQISQYFNDVIMDAASTSSTKIISKKAYRRRSDSVNGSDDEPKGPTEDDLKDLHKAHNLLKELWRACPAVLQNVIPQLEAELSAENLQLRLLSTETLGDIISGIGAAGLPPPPTMDSAAYPPLRLSDTSETRAPQNLLTNPSSPLQFPQAHPPAYASFLRRKNDKSPIIRSAWTTEIGRILSTSAGGAGLSQHEERTLIDDLAQMLIDADEKVRLAAVKVVGTFNLRFIIDKLGSVTSSSSVMGNLAERVRDRKHAVRSEAMRILARIWGVAAGEIAAEEEQAITCIAAAPSRILDTFYANDVEINALIDRALFEQLLPLSYPPIKSKAAKNVNGNSQRAKESQNGDIEIETVDPDKIRTERILILVKYLDERAKKVFFALQSRQIMLAKIMAAYIQRCEDYNGGVMDENETQIKDHLSRLIDEFTKFLPDPVKTRDHLWKFAKLHDRRSYQLIRFCIAPDSDYRIVFNAIKEFTKRIESTTNAPAGMLEILTPLLYRVGVIIYNKSHVPAIMEFSRNDEKSLAATAHEILREISSRTPEVLKAHVQEICKILEEEAPTSQKANDPSAVDNLKACASFSSKFAGEIPRGPNFVQAMTNFALYGTPPESAKFAVSIIINSSDEKELLARDLVRKCVIDFEYGAEGFLSRLASLSQLMLLAPNEVDFESDAVIDIAIQRILLQVRTPSNEPADSYKWSETVDEECEAKCWALKILVNRIRSHTAPETLSEHAAPIYKLLNTLISQEGEVSPQTDTPPTHKSRLRLLASRLYLKLCTQKPHDSLLIAADFNCLAFVAQDPKYPVRSGFLQRLKKYLGQQLLPPRFYAIPFLLAYEPISEFKQETTTWIRSRAAFFSQHKPQSLSATKAAIVMEAVFARLISLLAHHPDYASTTEDLISFSRYITFYLQTVATEENISLIYHIAERVKQYRDAVLPPDTDSPFDTNLYHLSDLAQLTIRKFEDAHSWTIQTLPAKIRLPSALFVELKDHDDAQRIAERNYLPEDVEDGVEAVLRQEMRAARPGGKKRKSDGDVHGDGREAKKPKGIPIRKADGKEKKASATGTKTPKNKAQSKAKSKEVEDSGERRRSGRVKPEEKNYVERSDGEDDEEMEVLDWESLEENQRKPSQELGQSDEEEEGVEWEEGKEWEEGEEQEGEEGEEQEEQEDEAVAKEGDVENRQQQNREDGAKNELGDKDDRNSMDMTPDPTPAKKKPGRPSKRKPASQPSPPTKKKAPSAPAPTKTKIKPPPAITEDTKSSPKSSPPPPKPLKRGRGRPPKAAAAASTKTNTKLSTTLTTTQPLQKQGEESIGKKKGKETNENDNDVDKSELSNIPISNPSRFT